MVLNIPNFVMSEFVIRGFDCITFIRVYIRLKPKPSENIAVILSLVHNMTVGYRFVSYVQFRPIKVSVGLFINYRSLLFATLLSTTSKFHHHRNKYLCAWIPLIRTLYGR